MTTLTVGVDKQYQTIAAAVAASQDGDVINVDAGTYTNEFVHITTNITLNAVGGMVYVNATVPPINAPYTDTNALFTTDGNVTINGFEFSGANWQIMDWRGCAGVRMQSGNLTLNNCYFYDNANGVLGSGVGGNGVLVIDNCEFDHNGDHGLYVDTISSVSITDSYIHDTVGGSEIKSNAASTTIINNRIQDEDGSASYCIDIAQGGVVTIQGNVIEQGPNTQNPVIIYGSQVIPAMGGRGSTVITDNIIINDYPSSSAEVVVSAYDNYPFPDEISYIFSNNEVYGLTASQLPSNQTGTTFLTEEPILDTSSPFTTTPPPPPPPPPPPIDLVLIGDFMRNTLIGGDGNDILDGKRNHDTMITGDGNDTIVFSTPLGKLNVDTCFDFSSVNDTVQLSASIFTNPALLCINSNTGVMRYDGTPFVVLPIGLTLTDINIKIV